MTITQQYLDSLGPPNAVTEPDFDTVVADITNRVASALPTWTKSPDSALAKVIDVEAYIQTLVRMEVNHALRSSILGYMSGADLARKAAGVGIIPTAGETDEQLRLRIPSAYRTLTISNTQSVIALAKNTNPLITDAHMVLSNQNQTQTLYFLKASAGLLTSDEKTTLTTVLNGEYNKVAGKTVVVADPVKQDYLITANIRYRSTDTDITPFQTAVRSALYAYILSHARLGQDIVLDDITAAIQAVPGAVYSTITKPAIEVTAVADTHYPWCPQDETNVSLTFTNLTP